MLLEGAKTHWGIKKRKVEMKEFLLLYVVFLSHFTVKICTRSCSINSFITFFKCSKEEEETLWGIKEPKVEIKKYLHFCFTFYFSLKWHLRVVQEIVLTSFIGSFTMLHEEEKMLRYKGASSGVERVLFSISTSMFSFFLKSHEKVVQEIVVNVLVISFQDSKKKKVVKV